MKNLTPEKFLLQKQNPADKAIITSSFTFTFDELKRKVLSAAYHFKEQNVYAGDHVGIIGKSDADFVINVLALWQLAAVPVPLNTRLTENEIDEQLILADCSCILAQEELVQNVKNINKKIITYADPITQNTSLKSREELKLDDPAVIIFTSGSSSKSKGIILSFNSLFNSSFNSNQLLRYTRSDRWLASLPFYHVGGFSILTRSLLYGIPIIIPDSFAMKDLFSAMNDHQPTFVSLVAAQLKKFVDEGISPNPELKNCLVGGGFSDIELLKAAYDIGWPINVVYGSTETSSFVTALLKDEITLKPSSVGRAVPTNNIFIYDNEGNELKPFEIGEIVVQSNALMSGYIDESETQRAVKNGFYYSGDIGFLDEDGYLFIEGRKNFLISSGGENVNPIEVEKALLQHPLVAEAAVFPLKDEMWGEIICAAVVLKEKSNQLTLDQLKEFLEGKISGFKIPKKIFYLDQFLKTELGKVKKDELIERYRLTSL
jgi:O-succinylbenzoic acid--CoA ligase